MAWMELSPPKVYVKGPTPKVIVFGDRALKEVIKVKWYHKGGDLIWQD